MADASSITSMNASMAAWLTPTSLFLLLNLMIGTIVLISRFGTQQRPQQGPQLESDNSQRLLRKSSLLERVRSINFSLYKFGPTNPDKAIRQPVETENVNLYPDPCESHQPKLSRLSSLLQRLKSINLSSIYRSDSTDAGKEIPQPSETEIDSHFTNPDGDSGQGGGQLVKRRKSETGSEAPVRSSRKFKKSFSEKVALGRSEEEDEANVERRRPATTRAEKRSGRASKTTSFGDDEGVDAKADDFINRFKQQLRLQRLDSLLRYRD